MLRHETMALVIACVELRQDATDLNVRVHVHKSPLAVLTINAKGHLHLFVQQNTHFDPLLLQEGVEGEGDAMSFQKRSCEI